MTLFKALELLSPDFDWVLNCVGSLNRDPELASILRHFVRTRGWHNRVFFLGEVSDSTLASYYEAADLFVLPSWHEGYGMVLAEALTWGLPIVTTSTGAIREMISTDVARMVMPGDSRALCNVLSDLMRNRHTWLNMSQAALKKANSLLNWEQATIRWFNEVTRLAEVA
jgi:glycosyltransferase involved in cell wall biosynthesis